jgi:NADPH2:quinone reductase
LAEHAAIRALGERLPLFAAQLVLWCRRHRLAILRRWQRLTCMKAVVCEAFGGPDVLAVREVPDPAPPGAGEVQVRIAARGVQYVDVLMLAGKYQFRPEPPFIPGGEAAGTVVAIGAGVTEFVVGEPVMSRHNLGAFAELGNAKAALCDRVPTGMSMEMAGVFRGAYSTAYHALMQRGRMKAGEWVLVHGAAGGIGIAAIQVAKLFGGKVIATASTEEKRATCLDEGADDAIGYQGGFLDRVKDLTAGRGVDIVYDPIGSQVTEESLRCLAWCGRLLILGFLGGGPTNIRSNYLLIKGIEAIGVRIGGLNEADPEQAKANMLVLTGLAAQGKLKPHISHRFPLARAAEAVQAVVDRKVIGKAVLTD